jgi:hypothetical protein
VIAWDRPAAEISALVRALDFGDFPNELAVPKVLARGAAYACPRVRVLDEPATAAPGTIVRREGTALVVAAADRHVLVPALTTLRGEPAALDGVAALAWLDDTTAAAVDATLAASCRHEGALVPRLADLRAPVGVGDAGGATSATRATRGAAGVAVPAGMTAADVVAGFAAYLARTGAGDAFDLGVRVGAAESAAARALFSHETPLRVAPAPNETFAAHAA